MEIYLVGGAVRDNLLNLPVKDKDWVVVGANENDMERQGFQRVGKDFPVYLHPKSKEEYALARRETKTAPGYKGFVFDSSPGVTLEQDLLRRDLTINAIAQNSNGDLIDPYHGRRDLDDRVLRHVSDAFREDPLRVLRVARFAARFAHLKFRVADETMALMQQIVNAGELEHLVSERVWQEFETALKETSPVVFFQTLKDCGALEILLPEVCRLFGVPQPERYHPEIDTGIHVFMCVEQATRLSDDPVVRYATLVHDVGKGVTPQSNWPSHIQHETLGLPLLDTITRRLKVPNEYANVARLVCQHHTKMHRLGELRSSTIVELLETLDAFRRPQRMHQFLLACEADARGRTGFEDREYPQREQLIAAFKAANELDIGSMLADDTTEKSGNRDDSPAQSLQSKVQRHEAKKGKDIKQFVRHQRAEAIKRHLGRKS